MFTVIGNAADWEKYKEKLAVDLALIKDRVKWGEPPVSFPCLATTLFPPRPNGQDPVSYSCFVYEADAELLLKRAGKAPVDPDAPQLPGQRAFNRWIAAQQLTIIDFMVDTGICKRGDFEERLLEAIELVDAYQTEKKAKLRDQLALHKTDVLDRLYPSE